MKVVQFNKSEESSGDNVIKYLEECLAMARDGLLKNVVVVAVTNDNDVMDCWANTSQPFAVVGGLEAVKVDFMDSIIERR